MEPVIPEPEPEVQGPEEGNSVPEEIPQAASPEAGDSPDALPRQDLGIARYIGGIARFIDSCKTPMTIAFQGNRGREENSVLRILYTRLGEQSYNHRLWLDARQFSMGESGEALALLCMQTGFRSVYDHLIQRKDNVTPEFLAGLCGCSPQPWGIERAGDGKKAAFQKFGGVFAHIINVDEDTRISESECRAFVEVLEFSSITSK